MRAERPKRKPPTTVQALAGGTRVGPVVVRNVLGSGAFGIVYRAFDPEGEIDLALKEYLPTSMAVRDGPGHNVAARSPQDAEAFAHGLRFFVNEGKLLAGLSHASLVKVHSVWEENGTAYMTMDLIAGRTLAVMHLARSRAPRESTLRLTLESLLGALEVLHRAGLQHRDIAPQTIIVEPSGRPVLLDLGSPRRVTQARGDTGPTGTRDGFAPIELYAAKAKTEEHVRGPWTDFYELGAVLHFMMSGKPPRAATERADDDHAAQRLRRSDGRYSLEFLGLLDWMLALRPADRPQSVEQLRAALAGKGLPRRYAPSTRNRFAAALQRYHIWLWLGAGLVFAGAAAAGARYLMRADLSAWLGG